MNKKEILLGSISGFLANTVGTVFSVIILFQEIKISNILRIVSNSISDNFITKLISLGAVMNLIVFFVFLRYDYCLLYTSPSPRDTDKSRMPSSA